MTTPMTTNGSQTLPTSVQLPDAPQSAARSGARRDATLLPPVDVIEDAGGITLYADMPGVVRDRVHVLVEGDQLVLEGDLDPSVPEGLQPTHAEVQLARYRRAFTLSKELDAAQVAAEMDQGVLRVRIPKAAHAQPRRVPVAIG